MLCFGLSATCLSLLVLYQYNLSGRKEAIPYALVYPISSIARVVPCELIVFYEEAVDAYTSTALYWIQAVKCNYAFFFLFVVKTLRMFWWIDGMQKSIETQQ